MRRCLGPIGGSVAFVLVAGLVFTGLGWVTVAALRVEDAQREAAAEAAVANKLRLALWRLDGRLLPALGAENARAYLEYAAPDPDSSYGPTCAPLLAAPLNDWMRLHAQLDPETGWSSPQVLTPEARDLFKVAWPQLTPTNATVERARALDAVQRRHQFKAAYAAFASRDGVPLPADNPRRPAPTEGVPAKMPPPPAFGLVNDPPPPAENGPKEFEQVAPPPKAKDAPASAPAPAPPPRPAAVTAAAENATRALERGDAGVDAQRRRRAADLAADTRNPSTYIYPPNFRQNTVDPQFQNGLNNALGNGYGRNTVPVSPGQYAAVPPAQNGAVLGRLTNPTALADRDGSQGVKSDEKAATFGLMAKGAAPADNTLRAEGAVPRFKAPSSFSGFVDFLARGLSAAPQKDRHLSMMKGGDANSKASPEPLALADRAKEERAFGPGASRPGGFPAGGGLGSGVGGFGGGVPTPSGPVAPPAPPGLAGPPTRAKSGAEKQHPTDGLAGRGQAATDPKAMPTALPAQTVFAPPGPPAGPQTAPTAAAPAPPAAVGGPQLPTPDPAPPPRLQVDQPAPPVAPVAEPVMLFNLPPIAVHLGPVRPQWLKATDGGDDSLVLVRTARLDNRTVYQGVVIDWPRLQEVLRDDIKDLFPDATLVPVKAGEGAPDRAMTALPVQLEPGTSPTPPPAGWTPLRIGLALAWAAALIAFGAIGLAGWSLIDLSERRIRFVSAVTHELRTPLTSLRLYLDLLLSGMVQDEGKRTEYLSTLAVESDRLHRLVDNVLDFARLERRRSGTALHPAKVADLLTAVRDTWTDRCGTDGKELIVVSTLPPEAEVTTDAALVGQIVGNLIDNARKYTRSASDPRVWVWAKPEGRRVVFEVEDRGPGVSPREQKIIFRPFRRGETADTTAGGAGLGLALCKQWAESLGGTLTYRPADGDTGACFRLELPGK